jgi:hypothetical protein
MKNYWGFRIDTTYVKELNEELSMGRLRQGWGYNQGQDLRNLTVDEGARRNLSMLRDVKKGDMLLVPHLPELGQVSIAEATEDWDKGYQFSIFDATEDHGHIFPAKPVKVFGRHNENVSGNLRSTLRNPGRFWNINHYAEDIEHLLAADGACVDSQEKSTRLRISVEKALSGAKESLVADLNRQFNATEWEYVLVDVFSEIYPEGSVERVGGTSEVHHGTDILITVPGIVPGSSYGIAIQVKDYSGGVGNHPVDQILKADHWNKDGRIVIDKLVVLIGASAEHNLALSKYADDKGVRVLFSTDVNELLFRYACRVMGQRNQDA